MGLPPSGWIPVKANDERFPVANSPIPQPLTAVYRDFSTDDLESNLDPITMNLVAVGPENTVDGVVGRTASFDRTLVVTLSQQNVYGVLLVDTLLIPVHSILEF